MTPDKFTTDRDDAIKWARKLFEDGEFVILDTETTGLDSAAEIMQFAFVNHNDTNSIQFDVCPSPNASLDDGAFRTHGITLESVATAPPITIWADNITEIVKGKTIIGWNVSFDYRMLIQSFNAWKVEPPTIIHLANFECAMLQYAKFIGDWDTRHIQYRWHKLPGATHGALADCRATLEVLRQMAETPLSTDYPIIEINTTIDYETETIRQDVTFEPPTAPEPAPLRTIAFEHGHGSVTQGPPPESTSTVVEVDLSAGMIALSYFLATAGAFVSITDIAGWTPAQRIEAVNWAAQVLVADISELLGESFTIPTRPTFIVDTEIDIPF